MPLFRWYSLVETREYITAAMQKPVTTSKTECCFKNMVDRIMLVIKRKEVVFAFLLPLNSLLLQRARCIPRELYTCMLGNRFVAVSEEYSQDTIWVKMLFRSKWVGRKSCPLGYRVETMRKTVIPVNRKVQS